MPALANFILLLAGGLSLIILAVIAVRLVAALKTRRWVQTQATILTSEPRRIRQGESGPDTIPHIVYEYTAGGKTLQSHQLKSRGVPMGQTDLPHFLGRYPVGASAVAYYNPANPEEAVLERETLMLAAERMGCLVVFAITVALVLIYGLKPLHGLVQRWFPHAENENVLVVAAAMGVFLILFGLMWLRQGFQDRQWPEVNGTVVASTVQSFRTASGTRGPGAKLYSAAVIYEYEVGGRQYQSSQIRREKVSGSEGSAQASAAKYPNGSPVRVYYNPQNPAEAFLETGPLLGFVVLWAVALVMFAVAASVSGYFRHQ